MDVDILVSGNKLHRNLQYFKGSSNKNLIFTILNECTSKASQFQHTVLENSLINCIKSPFQKVFINRRLYAYCIPPRHTEPLLMTSLNRDSRSVPTHMHRTLKLSTNAWSRCNCALGTPTCPLLLLCISAEATFGEWAYPMCNICTLSKCAYRATIPDKIRWFLVWCYLLSVSIQQKLRRRIECCSYFGNEEV
jgi:hypothetical protein